MQDDASQFSSNTRQGCESRQQLQCFSMTAWELFVLLRDCSHERKCGQTESLHTRECLPWHRCWSSPSTQPNFET
jgi:hypothetical protein